MTMEESLSGTRILSARRSKPDMAALVDQHRPMNAYLPMRRSELIYEDRIPVVSIENLPSDDSASSTYSPEPQTFVISKRISHRPKRLPKLRLRTVANGSTARGLHHSRTLTMHSHVESPVEMGATTTATTTVTVITNSTDEESDDDEDDNVPLSNFIPTKSSAQPSPPCPEPVSPCESKSEIVRCQCARPAVLDDPRWDGQYCSPECLISGCHRAFEIWLHMHRNGTGVSGC
ncbi:hypothetical protein FGIG_08665 [Fasciola gigantica]|uniref:TOX high mobility group box family member 4 n=1 Tax=Fasciola gigantica TaxID=46835 RepID=A0A504YP44_FASGI|nr:hypothetical protein FGIG_08665 [Fasciola gigantica]